MIRLAVEGYCQDCPKFEADVKKSHIKTGGRLVACHTYIQCENREICENLKKYLEKEIEKDD